MTESAARTERYRWTFETLFLVLVGLGMLWWSWGRWMDAVSDVGRELYVPWQIAEGRALYRDIAHFNGPLSQYFNATAFWLIGPSLRSLVLANLLVIAATTLLIHRITSAISNRWIAIACCFLFLTIFAFPPYPIAANYNFVTPYSHEITHGALLSLLAIWLLLRFGRSHRLTTAGACGFCLGAVFLTKPEIFLAAFIAVLCGFALLLWQGRRNASPVRSSVWFTVGLLIPPLLATALLTGMMPLEQAIRGVLGGWRFAFNPSLIGLPFYRRTFGTIGIDAYPPTTWIFFWVTYSAIFIGGMILLATGIGRAVRRHLGTPPPRVIRSLGAISFTAILLVSLLTLRTTAWDQTLRTFPLLLGLLALVQLILALRASDRTSVIALSFTLFALLLLAKMALNVRLYYYGFVLSMPGLLVMTIALVKWVPQWVSRLAGSAGQAVMAGAGAAAVAALWCSLLHGAWMRRGDDWIPLGAGPNRFLAEPRFARHIDALLQRLEQAPPDKTLAVLPEGAAINFLSRRANPTAYHTLLPPEFIMFGQNAIFTSLRDHPPDYIALLQRSTKEYGPRGFGRGYADPILRWIHDNYRGVWHTGGDIDSDTFGIDLLERN